MVLECPRLSTQLMKDAVLQNTCSQEVVERSGPLSTGVGGWAEPAAIREHGGPRPALLPRPGIAAKVCPAVCHQTCCSFKPVSKLRAAIKNAFNGNPFPFILACLHNESSQRCGIHPEQSPVVCSMSATDSDLDPGFPLQWPKHLNPLGCPQGSSSALGSGARAGGGALQTRGGSHGATPVCRFPSAKPPAPTRPVGRSLQGRYGSSAELCMYCGSC